MIRHAIQYLLPLSLVSTLLFLSACEQQTRTAQAQERDPAVQRSTENSRDFGDYVIHFNALGTDQLTPQIAQQYGIVRSRNRALLNVSILKKAEGSMGIPVTGSVSASAINLAGQLKNITLREIKEGGDEGGAVYYIGETTISDGETLIFTVDATPINEASRFTVRFMQQFFVND